MAGVALIVLKDPKQKQFLKNAMDKLCKYLNSNFSLFFEIIKQPVRSEMAGLIRFKKDENQKFYLHSDGSWIAYEGHVYALEQTRILDARILWDWYQTYDDKLPRYLDGDFVIKLYDAKRDEFLIINDIIKSKINYLIETSEIIFFSPFLVLSSFFRAPKPDPYALNEYLWRYYIQSDRTILKDVRRLKPASIYKIKDGKINHSHYWEWPRRYTTLRFNEAAEQLSESIKESARLIQKYGKTPVLELTMGQDSRMVAAGFTSQNIPFISTIYGKDDFQEVKYTRDMAIRGNREHHQVKLGGDYLQDPWRFQKKSILLGSAEEPGYLAGRIMYMRSRYKQWSDIALSGMLGRYYKDGLWNELYVFNLYREPKAFNIDLFLKYRALNKKYPDNIFNSEFLAIKKNSENYFKSMVKETIEGYEDSPVALQVDKFDLERYGMFQQISGNITNNVIDLISPLMLRRNLESALIMPPKWKYNLSSMQREVVFRLDPQLAAEKTDVADIDMVPKAGPKYLAFLMKYWFYQSKKLRDKIKNTLNISSKTQLQKAWNYYPIHQTMFQNDEVQDYLNADQMQLSDVLSNPEWQTYLSMIRTERISLDEYEFLFKILTIEYFLKEAKKIWNNG